MGNKIVVVVLCLLLIGTGSIAIQCTGKEVNPVLSSEMTRFSSFNELKDFVKKNTQSYAGTKGLEDMAGPTSSDSSGSAYLSADAGSTDYSKTNIQVAGVDEADIVKTDGEYIYLVSGNRVIIVKAYPASEAQIIAEITLDNNNVNGIFINGNSLVIIHQNWNYGGVRYYLESDMKAIMPETAEMSEPQTYIKVYDTSSKAEPVLVRDMSIDGNYVGSRMVGNYIYVITNAYAYDQSNELKLPSVYLGKTEVKIDATDIYYTNIPDYSYNFNIITSVNIKDAGQLPEYETLLLGYSGNIYVSMNNIYVATSVWSENSEKTAIQRIHISDGIIEYEASGEVPGMLLNQFSMDDFEDYFRVATTKNNWGNIRTGVMTKDLAVSSVAPENTSTNNVYILDMGLNIVGKLENLAPGEQIYSARFLGNKGYIVTFKKVDPLFVIDLSDPYAPVVLGQLKITGYSNYLHPYDENHLLGIGKETIDGLYQGVKISLFDVSDFDNPKEIAKYEIGDRGTDSPALSDHKALLFDKEKDILVLPISLFKINSGISVWDYGQYQGEWVYVFDISTDGGLELKGRITHNDGKIPTKDYYNDYGAGQVKRSLYISDVLYTLSYTKIMMNSLDDLSLINQIVLS